MLYRYRIHIARPLPATVTETVRRILRLGKRDKIRHSFSPSHEVLFTRGVSTDAENLGCLPIPSSTPRSRLWLIRLRPSGRKPRTVLHFTKRTPSATITRIGCCRSSLSSICFYPQPRSQQPLVPIHASLLQLRAEQHNPRIARKALNKDQLAALPGPARLLCPGLELIATPRRG